MTIHRTDVTDNVISESPAAIERGSVKTEKLKSLSKTLMKRLFAQLF